MIVLYSSPGCSSCRKVKQWLKDRELNFVEKNIFKTILNKDEIKYLLSRSENGTEDIISRRSKLIQQGDVDIDNMRMNDLVGFIQQNPSVLRRPIILSTKVLQVGYDEEEIDAFIPREIRKIVHENCNETCPHYDTCGKLREEN